MTIVAAETTQFLTEGKADDARYGSAQQEEDEHVDVLGQHHGDGHHQIDEDFHTVHKDAAGQVGDILHVAHHLGLDAAGLHLAVVTDGEVLQLAHQRTAQCRLHVTGSHRLGFDVEVVEGDIEQQ